MLRVPRFSWTQPTLDLQGQAEDVKTHQNAIMDRLESKEALRQHRGNDNRHCGRQERDANSCGHRGTSHRKREKQQCDQKDRVNTTAILKFEGSNFVYF